MSGVKLREGESFDSLLKRFRKVVTMDRILQEVKKLEFYEKPSEKKKRIMAASRRRLIRKVKRQRK
jgi:small subunit ribosomal protein S21